MLAIARNNHIAVPYRSTNTAAVHLAVPIASTLSGLEPLSLLLIGFASLAQLPLLVGARTRVLSTDSTISIEHHLTRASHHWESHPAS